MLSFFRPSARTGVAAAALALAALFAAAPNAEARLPAEGFADLAEELTPSVVNITTAQTVTRPGRRAPDFPEGSPFGELFKDFFDRGPSRPRRVQSLGSGFVIDAEGYVVTNNHVIEGADEIEVEFSNGESFPATLIGRDEQTDIALLKIDADRTFPAVAFGDSDTARVGDLVLAIGNPFGQGFSVSAGIISARGRDINAGRYDNFLQTDAAINRGNSGGPLFNLEGEVVGVNTAIISPTGGSIGIGFAVPANLAAYVVDQLRDSGEVRRGWLGVRIQEVDDAIAESIGLDSARGALVSSVDGGGPAEAGGVIARDVILKFDGRDIRRMRDLPRIVAETPVGKTVEVVVFRDGAETFLDVTIELLNEDALKTAADAGDDAPDEDPRSEADLLGMTLEAIDDGARRRYDIPESQSGVFIADIDEASSAYERGLRRGDVIVEIAQSPVATPAEARREIENAKRGGRDAVLLMVSRGGDMRFVAVEFEN